MKNSFDNTWEEIHQNILWGQYPSETIIRFMARNYYNTKRSEIKVLDFGVGAGANTWYLCREGFQVYGFDGSSTAVQHTKSKLAKEGYKAIIKASDALQLDYEEDFFDVIIDSCCIYANILDSICEMYKEAYRFLKPGGKLISTAFSKKTTGFGSGKIIEEDTYTDLTTGSLAGRGTVHFYDKDKIIEIIRQTGFSEITYDEEIRTENNGNNIIGGIIVTAQKG